MRVVELLTDLGGVASTATLVRLTSRAELERAVAAGDVVRLARGRYALPHAEEGVRAAHALGGVLSRTSAALYWGWEVKSVPARPHVTVPVKRKVKANRVHLHRADLRPDEIKDRATSPERTLLDCLRHESFDSALAVADSALRNGFAAGCLQALARDASGPGSPQIRRVAREASALADNPFESTLRAIALDVHGTSVRPQVVLPGTRFRADLVDEDLRIVIEADSFRWHGDRVALRRDAQRYNLMVVDGWIVLRFAWEDVMHDADYVREVLVAAVSLAHGRSEVPGSVRSSA